ncbi:MAG: endo-1,4-beta-xylanase [Saprospiraceae bacterium]|nr:endo-1,4-beta-xylanase [Saprospiraceae bacterium]MBP6566927.1 endo-1,4-beta-xylanase [Saprospiraceae bacterium]
MRFLIFLSLFALSFSASSQDAYHTNLVNYLRDNHNLVSSKYVLNNTEQTNVSSFNIYGNASVSSSTVAGNVFSISAKIDVRSLGNNVWDVGYTTSSKTSVAQGDVLLYTFWAKKNSAHSEIVIFAEDNVTYTKELYPTLKLTDEWKRYFLPFKVTKAYAAGKMNIGLHLASQIQNFDIAGLTLLNYGSTYNILQFPSSLGEYEGYEADAPWRAEAASRIENIRKANLTVNVKDISGNPLSGATVNIEMMEHEFGFGSAIVACRTPGNRCYNETYLSKLKNLDGNGHGFNVGVTENALKWDGWEEQWIGTPTETVNAVKWLSESGIKMRGHVLVWPGFDNLPEDMRVNKSNLPYLRNRINERLTTMLTHPELSKYIKDWDVINEITQNRDLEYAFDTDPTLSKGRDLYKEIFKKAKELQPELTMYINDYIVESDGGSAAAAARYDTYLDEIHAGEVSFDGIGFQAHIGKQPTSILKFKQIFDDYSTRYNARIKITEYDINKEVDPMIQARYLEDLLTMSFSHPSVDAFIMWGFWDGNHWHQNAPIFNLDWSIKPSGQAYIDKVFNKWWTNEESSSDQSGKVSFRPFKGKHKITVTKNGKEKIQEVLLNNYAEVNITMDIISSTNNDLAPDFKIYPNPTPNEITIDRNQNNKVEIKIMTIDGKLLESIPSTHKTIHLPLKKYQQSSIIIQLLQDGQVVKSQMVMVN